MNELKSNVGFILILSFVTAFFAGVFTAYAQIVFGPSMEFGVGSFPLDITAADFDSDGNIDLATANFGSGDASILLGNGDGTFGAATNIALLGNTPFGITSADFDNDGTIDLAVSFQRSTNGDVLLGNGDGTFSAPTRFQIGGNFIQLITNADFDNDGNIDLAAADATFSDVSVMLGTGTGTFGAPNFFFTGGNFPIGITASDFDNDGNIDLATANSESRNTSVILGDGSGGFGPRTLFGAGREPMDITADDFNNDGNVDLATANLNSCDVSVLLGDGTGSFGPMTSNPVGLRPFGITSADLNGDGNVDLAVANQSAIQFNFNISVLEGNGDGTFQAAVNFPVGGFEPTLITNADFNNDGLLDLACTDLSSCEVSVLLQIVYGDNSTTTQSSKTAPKQSNVTPKTWQTYTVELGDTLSDIANRFDTTISKLVQANPNIIDADLIYPGQVILINQD